MKCGDLSLVTLVFWRASGHTSISGRTPPDGRRPVTSRGQNNRVPGIDSRTALFSVSGIRSFLLFFAKALSCSLRELSAGSQEKEYARRQRLFVPWRLKRLNMKNNSLSKQWKYISPIFISIFLLIRSRPLTVNHGARHCSKLKYQKIHIYFWLFLKSLKAYSSSHTYVTGLNSRKYCSTLQRKQILKLAELHILF